MSHFLLQAGDAFNLMSEQTHLDATLQRDIDTIRSKGGTNGRFGRIRPE